MFFSFCLFILLEGTSVNKKRKRESSSSASSDNSSDSYSDSFSDSESIDQDPVSYRVQQPVFWSLSDSDFTWYFMRRKWKVCCDTYSLIILRFSQSVDRSKTFCWKSIS